MMDRRGWTVTDHPPAFLPERYVNPRTGEVTLIEAGIDPGFNYNVGQAYLEDLAARPIPTGRRAAGEAAQLAPAARAAAFLEPFGMATADRQGAVFIDAVGHPLAITPAWAEGAAGYSAAELDAVGRAIAEPDEIRQLWSTDAGGLTRDVRGDVGEAAHPRLHPRRYRRPGEQGRLARRARGRPHRRAARQARDRGLS
jgi:hypothetical protein